MVIAAKEAKELSQKNVHLSLLRKAKANSFFKRQFFAQVEEAVKTAANYGKFTAICKLMTEQATIDDIVIYNEIFDNRRNTVAPDWVIESIDYLRQFGYVVRYEEGNIPSVYIDWFVENP
jgi:hypothetical protein